MSNEEASCAVNKIVGYDNSGRVDECENWDVVTEFIYPRIYRTFVVDSCT